MTWICAFALTLVVELPCATALAPGGVRWRVMGDAFLFNLLSHPLAWHAFANGRASWWTVELAVLLVEAALYVLVTRLSLRRAAVVACVANGATAGLSWLL